MFVDERLQRVELKPEMSAPDLARLAYFNALIDYFKFPVYRYWYDYQKKERIHQVNFDNVLQDAWTQIQNLVDGQGKVHQGQTLAAVFLTAMKGEIIYRDWSKFATFGEMENSLAKFQLTPDRAWDMYEAGSWLRE